MSYREDQIRHETPNFWVLEVGIRGFEVYQKGATASTRVACVGHGSGPRLGLVGAVAEADRRQADLQWGEGVRGIQAALQRHGWQACMDPGRSRPALLTMVAKKTFQTAVGNKDAEVHLMDHLRVGNLCAMAKYDSGGGNVLESLWLPLGGFRYSQTIKSFCDLADTLVAHSYAAYLVRERHPVPTLTLEQQSAAWRDIFEEQASVMDVQEQAPRPETQR